MSPDRKCYKDKAERRRLVIGVQFQIGEIEKASLRGNI